MQESTFNIQPPPVGGDRACTEQNTHIGMYIYRNIDVLLIILIKIIKDLLCCHFTKFTDNYLVNSNQKIK